MFSKPVQPGDIESCHAKCLQPFVKLPGRLLLRAHMGAFYRRLWKHMIWLFSKELKNSWVSLKIVRVKPFQFIWVITGTLTSRRIKTFLRPSHSEAKTISNILGPNAKLPIHVILTNSCPPRTCLCNSRDAASCKSSGLSSSISACATKGRCGHFQVPTNSEPMSWQNWIGDKKLEERISLRFNSLIQNDYAVKVSLSFLFDLQGILPSGAFHMHLRPNFTWCPNKKNALSEQSCLLHLLPRNWCETSVKDTAVKDPEWNALKGTLQPCGSFPENPKTNLPLDCRRFPVISISRVLDFIAGCINGE